DQNRDGDLPRVERWRQLGIGRIRLQKCPAVQRRVGRVHHALTAPSPSDGKLSPFAGSTTLRNCPPDGRPRAEGPPAVTLVALAPARPGRQPCARLRSRSPRGSTGASPAATPVVRGPATSRACP